MSARDSEFARVYEEHMQAVYAFLAYRVHDRHLAEDLTQLAFERALRAWPRFDPSKGSERNWLLAIARNLIIDHHRRCRADTISQIDETLLGNAPGPEPRASSEPELQTALRHLGEREREIIALRFAADLTARDIAELTGLSVANVQQIISRSLRRLHALLEARQHD
jgi:RNA polymerase sigma factor (sigma-70 family)